MGKPATIAQFNALRKMYGAAGGDKPLCQEMMDDGTFKRFFENLLAEAKNISTFELTVIVNQERDWAEAIEALGRPKRFIPNEIIEVGVKYPATADGEEEINFVLRNFPEGDGSWDKALTWAKARGLKKTNPREVFAVVEQPKLRKALGMAGWTYFMATDRWSHSDDGSLQSILVTVEQEKPINVSLQQVRNFGGGWWFIFRE